MRWAITGVPGTGKTAITEALAQRARIFHLHDIAAEAGLLTEVDDGRASFIVDLDKLAVAVNERLPPDGTLLVEGHFAHEMDVDAILLLRCEPGVLMQRLRARGWPDVKIRENVEAEALDVLASEVLDSGTFARELDTTLLTVEEAARAVWEIVEAGPQGLKGSTVGTARWKLESLPWY